MSHGNEIKIRRAEPHDAAVIAAFQEAMAWETEQLRLESAVVLAGVQAVFADPAKGAYRVAVEQRSGLIVGVVLTIPEWSDWRNGTVLWLHSVYVRPDWRCRGVFRLLYDDIRREVEASSSLRGLRLYVERGNASAQAVYRAMGMSDEHYAMFEWLK